MGRTEQSRGLAPPAIRKDLRAKQARHIINKVIPAILASNARARKGADASELIVDPVPFSVNHAHGQHENEHVKRKERKGVGAGAGAGSEEEGPAYVKRKGQGRRKAKGGDEVVAREGRETQTGERESKSSRKGKKRKDSPIEGQFEELSVADKPTTSPPPSTKEKTAAEQKPERKVRIITTDTLTAAHILTFPSRYSYDDPPLSNKRKDKKNVLILNMASPLRPGGGVLSGATSQEEFLCARTTLLPSLRESFYRLPEHGGIYTPDVLVFRTAGPLDSHKYELGPGERYWIDVVSAGMLRFPELEGEAEGEEGQKKRLGKRDREEVERKMRGVLRIACMKGARRIVLGAWGCGAYGNPVGDVARTWRSVLDGRHESGKKGKSSDSNETWDSLEEVVFAIPNTKMASEFASEGFGGDIEVEKGPGTHADEDDEEEEDTIAGELRTKINEMEAQIAHVWNPELKIRMGLILDSLRAQLAEREGTSDDSDDENGEQEEEEEKGDVEKTDSSFSEGHDEDPDDGADEQDDRKSVTSRDGRTRALWC